MIVLTSHEFYIKFLEIIREINGFLKNILLIIFSLYNNLVNEVTYVKTQRLHTKASLSQHQLPIHLSITYPRQFVHILRPLLIQQPGDYKYFILIK